MKTEDIRIPKSVVAELKAGDELMHETGSVFFISHDKAHPRFIDASRRKDGERRTVALSKLRTFPNGEWVKQ